MSPSHMWPQARHGGQAEAHARENGRRYEWTSPVREGVTEDLFDLKGGGRYHFELRQCVTG